MLTISLEKVAYIIAKAREFDAEVPPEGLETGSNAADDGERGVLEDTPDNPTEEELRGAIEALNDPERIELLALLWLGRGDYTKEEWRTALLEARHAHDRNEADYLIGTPLLGDYLEEGLAQLGLSIEDYEIDRM